MRVKVSRISRLRSLFLDPYIGRSAEKWGIMPKPVVGAVRSKSSANDSGKDGRSGTDHAKPLTLKGVGSGLEDSVIFELFQRRLIQ